MRRFPELYTSVKALVKQFTLQYNTVLTPIMASNVVNVALVDVDDKNTGKCNATHRVIPMASISTQY